MNPPWPRVVNRTTIIPMNATSSNMVSAMVPALDMLEDVLEVWRSRSC